VTDDEIYNKRDMLLTEIHSDIRHLVKAYDKHVQDDKDYQESNDKKVEFHSKVIYCSVGALALFQLILKVLK